jgi:hypothetical protein
VIEETPQTKRDAAYVHRHYPNAELEFARVWKPLTDPLEPYFSVSVPLIEEGGASLIGQGNSAEEAWAAARREVQCEVAYSKKHPEEPRDPPIVSHQRGAYGAAALAEKRYQEEYVAPLIAEERRVFLERQQRCQERIMRLRQDGRSLRFISAQLNREGVKHPRTRLGSQQWYLGDVRNMLRQAGGDPLKAAQEGHATPVE